MVYDFLEKPQVNNEDALIATALNGEVYNENKRLHIKNNTCHYIYKTDASPEGWYRRNLKTSDDIYIGLGASPSIILENLSIKNETYWVKIFKPRVNEE